MPQVWKVKKAFQSSNRETKEPDVVKTQGGDMHKWMAQVEGQPVDGWLQILKKPGNELSEGDELYGDIVENNWGKPQFNRANRPQEMQGGAPAAPAAAPAPQNSGNASNDAIMAELKYIRGLLENQFRVAPAAGPAQSPASDDGDGPVDLTQLNY